MDLINKYIIEAVEKKNQTAIDDFEGYSPNQMQYILYKTFDKKSTITINKVSDSVYNESPLFAQIKYLLNVIKDSGELLLTKKGFLPVKVVASIYNQNFIKDPNVEDGIVKLYKEVDVNAINITRILLELSPFVKKRNNKLSLTKKGNDAFFNTELLFNTFFEIFTQQFNWAYHDRYEDQEIGQMGFGFTLILLNKYGNQFNPVEFYATKYLNAFHKQDYLEHNMLVDDLVDLYALRSFSRSLNYFGLIEVQKEFRRVKAVKKTKLFDKLITITSP